ncbi:type IV secretory system conjugative DNA transfer family protein [Mycobacterium sp. Z3061]|uniref:type IV secretory system conjugative DNA transfer family protein n=1 Tax=Mycobacterium sp. Z3061 TaxID=3073562 RepID=UPI003D816B34
MLDITSAWQAIAFGDIEMLLKIMMFIPLVITSFILLWLNGQYQQYAPDINLAFAEFEIKNLFLQKWFKLEASEHWPDIVLGPESESRELLIQPGRDRTLNNIIIGSIGTGKTSALILPILNQDLHWMTRFINDYPSIYKRKDFHTEEIKGMYLNGISVIEPSNDLCEKAYRLVKAHGIPDEAVFYIDPTNPDTPSINPMQGPVEKVAEAFAMVMEGLAEGKTNNFFFQQSERNHLKHYIYLLKLHDPEQEVTFDMLLKMYDNPQLVRRMHIMLKETIPEGYESLENRDERNHWAIVKQIDEWFDMNLVPKTVRGSDAPKKVLSGEYRGEDEYYDAKTEYVQNLRNVLNDIGANPLIRRVLFGKTNFDFDRHLEMGGVLLVNTAKGELGGLSNVLGKLVLLSLQNAVFRRKPNVSTFHHIVVDEFPDYVYRPFKEFPAQSRKYKTIITVVAQTVTQLADKYGETYMQTLLGSLRHKMVYGDIPSYDAELFSKVFGEQDEYVEGINEQSVSPLQENPVLRQGISYQKKRNPILSPSDIIYQKPFQCAVKIVINNRPIPVKQIDANFVPKEEFENATISVNMDSAQVWLTNRNNVHPESFMVQEGIEQEEEETSVEQIEETVSKIEQPFEIEFEDYDLDSELPKVNSSKEMNEPERIKEEIESDIIPFRFDKNIDQNKDNVPLDGPKEVQLSADTLNFVNEIQKNVDDTTVNQPENKGTFFSIIEDTDDFSNKNY